MRATAKGLVAVLAAVLTWSGAAVPTFAANAPTSPAAVAAPQPKPAVEPSPAPPAARDVHHVPAAPVQRSPLIAAGGSWAWQNPQPDAESIFGLACLSTSVCFAGGEDGALRGTTNGGATWTQVAKFAAEIFALSCADTTHCAAVGTTGGRTPAGFIASTSNGGASWTQVIAFNGQDLFGVSCPSATSCFATGWTGTAGWAVAFSPGSASVSMLVITTSQVLAAISCPTALECFTVGSAGVIFRTIDGGATWSGQNSTTTSLLYSVACPGASNCDVVGDSGLFLETTDAGNTWLVLTNRGAPLFGVSCPDATHCFVAAQDGSVYLQNPSSAPLGRSSTPETGALFAISCPSPSLCLAAGSYGVIVATTNGGTGWTTKLTTPGSQASLSKISCPSPTVCFAAGWNPMAGDAGLVLMSSDGGNTWTKQAGATAAANSKLLEAISCPTTGVCYATGNSGTIIKTSDAGATWAGQTSPTTQVLFGVNCPTTSTCYAVGLGGTIIKTADGGATWTAQASNTTDEITDVSCPSAMLCFASVSSPLQAVMPVNAGHVFVTQDGGAHWSVSFDPALDPNAGLNSGFNTVVCPNATTCYAGGGNGLLAATTDGGVNWHTDDPGTINSIQGISCPAGGVCFATQSSNHALLYTTDFGGTWQSQWSGDLSETYLGIACTSVTTCLALGYGGSVIATTTAGAAWTRQAPAGSIAPVLGLACTDVSNCYGAAGEELFVTHSGGSAWTTQALGTGDFLLSISCPAAGQCFAVGWPGAIYTTSDSGTTWTYIRNPLSGSDQTLTSISCASATTCVAVATQGIVVSTANGGASWSFETSGTTSVLFGVSCANWYSCVAVGQSGLALARSGGTWHAYPTGTTSNLHGVDCPTAPTCFAVGNGGVVIKTGDGGGTWQPETSGTTRALWGIKCATTTTCLADGVSATAIITLDGASWSIDSPPGVNTLRSVAWGSLNTAWLGGAGGTILVNNGVTNACGSLSAVAQPSSPQTVGTMVTINALAQPCPNPLYEFWMRPPGGSWTLMQPWSTGSRFNWDSSGGAAGTYRFSVWARDASSSNAYDSFFAFNYVLTVVTCSGISIIGSPSSTSVPRGQSVQFAAAATGCPTPLYQFWLLPPGGTWTVVQPYSANNTFNWNTFVPTGDYRFSVWVHDASNSNAYDAFNAFPYTITPSNCSGVTTTSMPSGTAVAGGQVAISATATGCPFAYFEFWLRSPAGSWAVVQGYSSASQFVWSTAGLAPGTYRFSVWAGDGLSPSSYQAFSAFDYTLTTMPCTGMGASASPQSSAPSGTTVAVFGTASGCPAPLYEFWLLPPSGGWMLVQPYSTQTSFSWNTFGLPPGTYRFSVWARDASSIAPYDAFNAFDYTLTVPPPCASVTVYVPYSTAPVGTTVTISASASGCPNPQYEFWILPPGGTWTLVSAWSSYNTITWYTRAPSGTYRWSVWARDVSSSAYYEAFNAFNYVLT